MTSVYLITGTSRGIGLAVASRLLDTGHRVYGISRKASPLAGREGYRDILGSVTDSDWVEPLFKNVHEQLAHEPCDMLCLLNNAAVLEPMYPIERCPLDQIRRHVAINLTAPMLLTAQFMAAFGDLEGRKKVAFMTSGAATAAFPDAAPYCTVKAGISMFCACVGTEQEGRAHAFETVSIDPGMVETYMQKTIRAMSTADFRPSEMFREAKAGGVVQDPETVAHTICAILEARTDMGKTVSVADWD